MASKTSPSVSDCERTSMSPFVQKLYNSLRNNFHLQEDKIPEVSVGPFNKGEELFGSQRNRKIMLLDREDPSKIKLLQFDPNFFSPQVVCRFKGCSEIEKKEKAQGPKRDLFLCSEHYKQLKRICGQPRYDTKISKEDYCGYIKIIGVLDAAYRELNIKTAQSHSKDGVPKSKSRKQTSRELTPQEILGFRNILVLTNVLLNPSMEEIQLILEQLLPPLVEWAFGGEVSEAEVRSTLDLCFTILYGFGIIYPSLPESENNPGKIIGWGTGGLTGFIGFYSLVPYLNNPELLALSPRDLFRLMTLHVSAHCICTLSIAFFFGFIASGVYQLYNEQRRRPELHERVNPNLRGIYNARSTQDGQNVELEFVPQHGGETEDNDDDDARE